MSAQMLRDTSFPIPCRRCGEVLDQLVEFCPHCGTDRPLDTLARTRPKPALRALGPTAVAPPVPAAAKLSTADPSTSDRPRVKPDYMNQSPFDYASPFWRTGQLLSTKSVLLVALVLAIGYAGYLQFGEGHKQEGMTDEQSDHAAGGSDPSHSLVQPVNAMPAVAAAESRSTLPKLRQMQRDKQRDVALLSADRCARERDWACVQQQASEALAIDAGNPQIGRAHV